LVGYLLTIFSGLILLYTVNNLYLIWSSRKYIEKKRKHLRSFPKVSLQLPIFNEKEVISRLIDSAIKLDWPKDSLEILILDDSSDETSRIIDKKIDHHHNIRVIRRKTRDGYKAGALHMGLFETDAKYIAILDADFLPEKTFLKQVVPVLEDDDRIGFVQTRWGHINREFNGMTKAISIALDWHHHIEQAGRDASNLFINFNGSCGVFRRKAIIESGGWKTDTLSEDLDIRYRIQMNRWKGVYLRDVVVPGEIPPIIEDYRIQQSRWAKGSIQCSRNLLSKVLRGHYGVKQKIQSLLHLNGYSVYLWTMLLMLLSVPVLLLGQKTQALNSMGVIGSIGVLSQLAVFGVLLEKTRKPVLRFAEEYLFLFITSIGLSIECSISVIRGLLTRGGEFLSTPKYNIREKKSWKPRTQTSHSSLIPEFLFVVYSCIGIIIALSRGNFGMLLYFSLHTMGFLSVILLSIKPDLF